MKAKGSTISLLDKPGAELTNFASTYRVRSMWKGPLDSSKSIAESTMNGKAVWVEENQMLRMRKIEYPKEAMREGITSIISIPLIVWTKVLGALRVCTGEVIR